eukprot:Skav211153  [mRNA]  locus=scaffold413:361253:362614:+ [translate_table: standard]
MALSIVALACWIESWRGASPFTHGLNSDVASGARQRTETNLRQLRIPSPRSIRICNLDLLVVSAVPVFTQNDSYIALITEENSDPLWRRPRGQIARLDHLLNRRCSTLFCSGPHRSHVSRIKYLGSVWICPWPSKERHHVFFNLHLEDAEGTDLGKFVASHDPKWLGQYKIMACIRDMFGSPEAEDQGIHSGVFSSLVQWMEWSLMKGGVEHFLVYKFNGTDSVEENILKPYFDAGVASMVYFDSCPDHPDTRHGYTINDCLFRVKNHAEWLWPVIDIDEYLHVDGGLAHALKASVFGNLDGVHSLAFKRTRFAKVAMNRLDISSTRYVPHTKRGRGWSNPKQFVHVDSTYRVSTHETVLFDESKRLLEVDPNIGIIHHYRFPWNITNTANMTATERYEFLLLDRGANATDESLLTDVASLTEALRSRFGLRSSQEVEEFLQELAQTPAPKCR